MATVRDIGVSAFVNVLLVFLFLAAFALLRIQPVNYCVYFPRQYLKSRQRNRASEERNWLSKHFSLDVWSWARAFLEWMPTALKQSQNSLISDAGLDSFVFLRIYILGLRIFLPITLLAVLILIPVNASGGKLFHMTNKIVSSDIDKLSISNVGEASQRLWIHILMIYIFSIWTCYVLYMEYKNIVSMRLHFLASQPRNFNQFTVLVQNIQSQGEHSISESVDIFFKRNHPEHYLGHQVVYNANTFSKLINKKESLQKWLNHNRLKLERNPGRNPMMNSGFLGICGKRVDSIDYYGEKIDEIERKITHKRQNILKDSKYVLPVAFVIFDSRWAAAVCAQTQQGKNPTEWLTSCAPEPRDVYWNNLAIPFVSLSIRRLLVSVLVFGLIFFYIIPIAFVQSLANLEALAKLTAVAPFLRPVVELKLIKSFIQGYLPALILEIFLYFLPNILLFLSKIEGHISLSSLQRKAASKYYYFMLVNVFLGSIVAGTAFEQLYAFLNQSATQIPRTIGLGIPMKATFFITFIMADGWTAVAFEILRLKDLIIYHLKSVFIVKTERDREKAMDPGGVQLSETVPKLELYFLVGLVYGVVSPILLPFLLLFFGFSYAVYRHQIINVYNQEYESAGAFWPHVHTRIIGSLLISHMLLLGLLSVKKAAYSTPLLVILSVLTLSFHKYCKSRFEPAFRRYPLEEAMEKDALEKLAEPDLNLRAYLADAYLHPIFQSFDESDAPQDRADKHVAHHSLPVELTPSTSHPYSPPCSPRYVYHYDLEF